MEKYRNPRATEGESTCIVVCLESAGLLCTFSFDYMKHSSCTAMLERSVDYEVA